MTKPSSLTTTSDAPGTSTRPSLNSPCRGSNSSGTLIAASSRTSSTWQILEVCVGPVEAADGPTDSAASMTAAAEGRACFLCFFLPAPVKLASAVDGAAVAAAAYVRTMNARCGWAGAGGSAARREDGTKSDEVVEVSGTTRRVCDDNAFAPDGSGGAAREDNLVRSSCGARASVPVSERKTMCSGNVLGATIEASGSEMGQTAFGASALPVLPSLFSSSWKHHISPARAVASSFACCWRVLRTPTQVFRRLLTRVDSDAVCVTGVDLEAGAVHGANEGPTEMDASGVWSSRSYTASPTRGDAIATR